jgi:hypothetical protein
MPTRLFDRPGWSCSKVHMSVCDDDGSAYILSMFDGVPETYRAGAIEYHERDLPLGAIESVYQHRALTDELVATLNPQQSLELLTFEIADIGHAG